MRNLINSLKQHSVKLIFLVAGFAYMTGIEMYYINHKRQASLNGTWTTGCIDYQEMSSLKAKETTSYKDGYASSVIKIYMDDECKKEEVLEVKDQWNFNFVSDTDMQLSLIKHEQALMWVPGVNAANDAKAYNHNDWKLGEFKDVSNEIANQVSKSLAHVDFEPNGYTSNHVHFVKVK